MAQCHATEHGKLVFYCSERYVDGTDIERLCTLTRCRLSLKYFNSFKLKLHYSDILWTCFTICSTANSNKSMRGSLGFNLLWTCSSGEASLRSVILIRRQWRYCVSFYRIVDKTYYYGKQRPKRCSDPRIDCHHTEDEQPRTPPISTLQQDHKKYTKYNMSYTFATKSK